VYDFPGVKELGGADELPQVALDLKLGQALASLEDLGHGLVVAQLEDNVDIIRVLKGPLKLND
jgi:hypothetical protein